MEENLELVASEFLKRYVYPNVTFSHDLRLDVEPETVPRGNGPLIDDRGRIRPQAGLINLPGDPSSDTFRTGTFRIKRKFLGAECVVNVAAMCAGNGLFQRHVDGRRNVRAGKYCQQTGGTGTD